MRSGPVGRCGGRGSELVEYRIRSEHFRLAGSMFLSSPPCVCGAGTGEGGKSDWGAYACGVCACAGRALAIYQRCLAGLAANAYSSLPILWHRHARRRQSPREGRRTAVAVCTSAFWTFWSSCTAVMHGLRCDRSGLRVWGRCCGGGEAKAVKGGAAHMLGSARPRERGLTQAATRVHRCACEGRGWGRGRVGLTPGARGRGHPGRRAREGKRCSVMCDVRKQLCPAARREGRPQGSSRQQWVWVSW